MVSNIITRGGAERLFCVRVCVCMRVCARVCGHHRVSGSTEGALFLARPPPASVHSCTGQTATGDITVLAGKRRHIFRMDFWGLNTLHLLF